MRRSNLKLLQYLSVVLLLIMPLRVSASNAPDSLRMVFVGDIMCHESQFKAAKLPDGTYDFITPYDSVMPYFSTIDIVIGNLETTLGEAPYSGYPHFRSPEIMAEQLREVGFDILFTTNNHSADRGLKGIENTIRKVQASGIKQMGTFFNATDRDERTPLLLDTLGIEVAFLAYTYGTNDIEVPKPAEVALIDTVAMAKELEKTRALNPDLIVVYMHWGEEYQLEQSKEQVALAEWLRGQGVDAIIGSHPHVCQPLVVERLDNGGLYPIAYSMGNFISNQYFENTQDGMMVELLLVKEDGETTIREVKQIDTYCNREVSRANHYRVEIRDVKER
ncbi:MAG: CapA family protein [Porphyromonas sp.]|nr:CapA family protein [Porphyromonas sp.]